MDIILHISRQRFTPFTPPVLPNRGVKGYSRWKNGVQSNVIEPVCPKRCKITMHNFFTNSICEKTWIGIMENIREIRGWLICILKHLFSKSKIRGWLICEIGLYASIYGIAEFIFLNSFEKKVLLTTHSSQITFEATNAHNTESSCNFLHRSYDSSFCGCLNCCYFQTHHSRLYILSVHSKKKAMATMHLTHDIWACGFTRKCVLTLKVLNFWKFTSYCNLKPLWSGMGEVVPAHTSPTLHAPSPPTVHQLSQLALLRVNALTTQALRLASYMCLRGVCTLPSCLIKYAVVEYWMHQHKK